jgi:hypothetical protein
MKLRVIAAAIAFATAAWADEPDLKPAQEEAKAKADEAIEPSLKALNEKCGTSIKAVKMDYENFTEATWSGRAFYSWCPGAVDAIADMCTARPAYKKALGKKLTGVSCLFKGVKGPEKNDGSSTLTLRNMSFEKGVFTFRLHPDAANVADSTKETLEKALN